VADYLQYWKDAPYIDDTRLDHTASDQLSVLRRDDVVWIVTFRRQVLLLLGPIVVDRLVSQRQAEKLLNMPLWEAQHHAMAKPDTVVKPAFIDLTGAASRLRFDGPVSQLPRGFSGRSFQRLRRLTPQSAAMLAGLWSKATNRDVPARRKPAVFEAIEGLATETKACRRGRSRQLRDEALRAAKGRCEACGYDYSQFLDGDGIRVLQVHHRQQIAASAMPRLTRLSDLAVLCANCHALVHMDPTERWPSRLSELD
jgi:hypothetical protein